VVVALGLTLACAAERQAARPGRAPVEARAAVDRAVATTGDLLTYTVTVEHDPGIEVEIPEAGAEIAGFRIVDFGRKPARAVAGRRSEERWYQLRADLVGSYVLPPVAVRWRRGPAGETGTIETSEIFVEVASVLAAEGEATDIRDVKALRRIARGLPRWALLGAVALLAAGAGTALWLWRRRSAPAAPPLPPHEVAFRALDALRGIDVADPAALRRFHFRISEVIRAYVEARFGLNASDLTTEEILPGLAHLDGLAPAEAATLARFLLATDRVKFAAHTPDEAAIRDTYEAALSFVEATRPAPLAEAA
jgi:hypothetical protein